MIFSPIPITEFMSWVLMRVVILYSRVMSCISSSMTSEVLGSSQNKYCGFRAMARAMATRFCIPPLISPGNLSLASIRFTRSKQNMARRVRSRRVSLLNMFSGNITLSSTVMESNSAALWKIIPISRRSASFPWRGSCGGHTTVLLCPVSADPRYIS